MKFIHTADFHLCSDMSHSLLPTDAAQAHRRQLFDSFNAVAHRCVKERADMWLIAGDLFDTVYAKASDIKRAAEVFESVGPTRVFISCGNHDPLTPDSYYNSVAMPPNVTIFPNELSRCVLDDIGVCVYGFSWEKTRYDAAPFKMPKLDDSFLNILCLHCNATAQSPYMPIPSQTIVGAGFDYVALGHIHKHTKLSEAVIYSGSPEPLDFGEGGRHGFILGELTKESRNIKFVNMAARRFVTSSVDVTGLTSHSSITKSATEQIAASEKDIVRLTFTGLLSDQLELENVYEELQKKYYCILFEDETSPDYDIELLRAENKNNLIGLYIDALKDKAATDETAADALALGLKALMSHYPEVKR